MLRNIALTIVALLMMSHTGHAQSTPVASSDTLIATKHAPTTQPVISTGKVTITKDTAAEPAYPKEVPITVEAAVENAKMVKEAARAGKWFGMSAGIIWLLMALFKWARKGLSFMSRVPKRVMWLLVPGLSIVATVLGYMQAGLTWETAPFILLSGPCVAYANDFVKRGIFGKEPTTTINGPASS